MKTCTQCNASQPLTEFHRARLGKDGLAARCKACLKSWRESYKKNKNLYDKQRYSEYKQDKKRLEKIKVYRSEHAIEIAGSRLLYQRRQLLINPSFKISRNLRSRLYKALQGITKNGSAVRDLGCTIPELKNHLESKFVSGMSWENYGAWHIDHVKPLASFDLTDREQFLQACHYTNLQPLWAMDNLSKGARV